MLAQLSPSTSLIIALALAFGLSDAGNNTVLSILIGKLFAERSEVRYHDNQGKTMVTMYGNHCLIVIIWICFMFSNDNHSGYNFDDSKPNRSLKLFINKTFKSWTNSCIIVDLVVPTSPSRWCIASYPVLWTLPAVSGSLSVSTPSWTSSS